MVPGRYPDSLNHYLASSEGAGRLMAHARLLQKLARIYCDAVPDHLGASSRVANYKSGKVVIHADYGAVAVKLRQMAPTLTREFSLRGVECNGVTVKVQGLEIAEHSHAPAARPLSGGTCKHLESLAAGMPPSPLRDAIDTLLARAVRKDDPGNRS